MLESHYDPHCMSCRTAWGKRFLVQHLPKSFLTGDWVRRRQQILFERERARFPATVELIAREKRIEEILNTMNRLRMRLRNLQREYWALQNNTTSDRRQQTETKYERGCPAPDCRGFLEKESGKCGICESTVCLECNTVKSEEGEHTCKDEDISVWKEISSNTRPCPNCHVRIFKVSGCNQMWCPQCQTAFDWCSGIIVTGTIHNPHYYEWLFRNRGAENDNHGEAQQQQQQCVEERGLPPLNALRRLYYPDNATAEFWYSLHRLLVHIEIIEIPKFASNMDQDTTLDIRKRYLSQEINDANFMVALQQREKKRHRECEIRRVLEMFRNVGGDLVRTLVNERDFQNSRQTSDTAKNLIAYVNESMRKIAEDYQCKVPAINEDLMFVRYT